jgi:hypothetical protein
MLAYVWAMLAYAKAMLAYVWAMLAYAKAMLAYVRAMLNDVTQATICYGLDTDSPFGV